MIRVIGGVKSGHAIITPTCRRNRGINDAFLEAAERLRIIYEEYAPAEGNRDVNWHLVLVREAPAPRT